MKIIVDSYDPVTGNVMVNGFTAYIGYNVQTELDDKTNTSATAIIDSEAIKLAKLGYTAEQLIQLRKAGIL